MTQAARILVVDDEVPVCKSVASALTTENYEVDTALSAEEALKKRQETRYDVIITDLMMPGLSGMDLLRTVKEKGQKTAVIMITGYPSIKSAVEATKLGAFDYIPKPFTPNELRGLVSRALETGASDAGEQAAIPSDLLCIPNNSWMRLEDMGNVRVGIHHVFLRGVGDVVDLELPRQDDMRYQGEVCARITDSQAHVHRVWTPVSGRVAAVNKQVQEDHSRLVKDPYGEGWLLELRPTDLESDMRNLVTLSPG
jgi:CheY-like chemotaxis protein/glycine cleavage system H lipoate-binding protein